MPIYLDVIAKKKPSNSRTDVPAERLYLTPIFANLTFNPITKFPNQL
jgi:hypothetical protein